MNNEKKKTKIKVIKKNEIGVEKKPKTEENPQVKTTRNIVATITTWVKDAQERRSENSRAAVEFVYESNPQNA